MPDAPQYSPDNHKCYLGKVTYVTSNNMLTVMKKQGKSRLACEKKHQFTDWARVEYQWRKGEIDPIRDE